jgi:hypothetical protein
MFIGVNVMHPSFLSGFNETCFLDRFSKNIQLSNFLKIRPLGSELFHAGGRADILKLTVAFHSSANTPKSVSDKSCRENQNTFYVDNRPAYLSRSFGLHET